MIVPCVVNLSFGFMCVNLEEILGAFGYRLTATGQELGNVDAVRDCHAYLGCRLWEASEILYAKSDLW